MLVSADIRPNRSTDAGHPAECPAKTVDVSIVLTCWNSLKYLRPCLQSIHGANLGFRFEIVVADNGSTDGSLDMVRQEFPSARIVECGVNLGFAGGTNQGIAASRGRYVLLLNCDTLIDGRSLDSMVNVLDQRFEAGAVGGRLLNTDGSFQAGYASFSTLWQELLIASGIARRFQPGYPANGDSSTIRRVDWISAACLLVRAEVFDQVGLLDEEYFMYSEEVDLQFRMNLAGWSVYFVPTAETIHHNGGDQDHWRRRRMVYRGKMLFYRKHRSRWTAFAFRVALATLSAAKMAAWLLAGVCWVPGERAVREFRSNGDVFLLALRLH